MKKAGAVTSLAHFHKKIGFKNYTREEQEANIKYLHEIGLDGIAEASLVYHTPIGPVSLALTKYDLRNWKNMYLTFNFGYAIFAPKGTFY